MALIFADSFDHYNAAYIPSKWTASFFGVGAANFVLNTTNARTGPQCAQIGNAGQAVTIENSTIWTFGAAFNWQAYGGGIAFAHLGTIQVQCLINSDGTFTVSNGPIGFNPGTALGSTNPSVAVTVGRYYYIEFQSVINKTGGTAVVRINGQVVLSLSGVNTSPNGDNVADQFVVFGPGGSNFVFVDDLYVTDGTGVLNSFLGDVAIGLIMPASDGDFTQWTPSTGSAHFSLVNEVPPDGDSTYVWTIAPSSGPYPIDCYHFQPVLLTRTIIAIQVNVIARKSDTGNRALSAITRFGGANNIANPSGRYVNETYIDYRSCYDVNPLTTNPWTPTDVNNTQWGYQLIA
jgi:hypothetical protein